MLLAIQPNLQNRNMLIYDEALFEVTFLNYFWSDLEYFFTYFSLLTNLLQIGKQYATILYHFVDNVTVYSTQFTE